MAASHSLLCLFSLSLLLLSNTANSRHLQNNEVSVQEGCGPWGGNNQGTADAIKWQFTLGDDEKITRIIVRYYDIVDAIGLTVVDANGYITTKEYGNPISRGNYQIILGDEEYITQISGTYGNYKWNENRVTISSLKIQTNKNVNGYGPFGSGADVSNVQTFSCSGGHLVGLYGTIGSKKRYLESIGISFAESSLKSVVENSI